KRTIRPPTPRNPSAVPSFGDSGDPAGAHPPAHPQAGSFRSRTPSSFTPLARRDRAESGCRRSGTRQGIDWQRRIKAVGQAGDEVVRVVARPVMKVRVGNPKHGFGRRQVAIVEVEREQSAEVIPQASNRLVAKLPTGVAEKDPGGWDAEPVRHVHGANADA